ncbi:diacylglycerol O-acyltransferase [Thraustotheca clavata]|uniref:Diacylglycerol O-acyltransferase n=1 Tax=Thraustotheca clavata TaxID=74557 RepID=A0A1W0ABA1_9STRA|nr:diacylglycerol O-acyltransferase [Thraustotheca clavata]
MNKHQVSQVPWRKYAMGFIVADFTAFLMRISIELYQYAQMTRVHPYMHDISTFILLFAVPLTHLLQFNVCEHAKDHASERYYLTFRAYQIASWTVYAVALGASIATSLFPLLALPLPFSSISITCLCFIAEMFMVSSILILDKATNNAVPLKAQLFVHNYVHLLAIVGATFLSLVADTQHDALSSDASMGSLLLCVAAITSTYGLGGILSNDADAWQFYQPFRGGGHFIRCQFVAWFTFAISLLLQTLFLLSFLVIELEVFVGIMGVAAFSTLCSQVSMMISIFLYTPPSSKPVEKSTPFLQVLTASILCNLPLFGYLPFAIPFVYSNLSWSSAVLYTCAYIGSTTLMAIAMPSMVQFYTYNAHKSGRYHPKFWIAPAIFYSIPLASIVYHYLHQLPALNATIVFGVCWYLYYVGTMLGMPAQTGNRMRRSLIKTGSPLIGIIAKYFSVRILSTASLDPKDTYIMGFHPHGIYPLTVMWLQLTEEWRNLFPGVFAHPLSASVVHYIPLLRDAIQLFGAREVARSTFKASLDANQSVMLVPGGQAEMLHSKSNVKQIRVYTKHKGFLRLALEHGTPVVPVLSYQEGEILDNVEAPAMQNWFVKHFAVPCPFFPNGVCYLPIPRHIPMTVAVGAPISVEKIEKPSAADVDALHKVYFDALRTLFETNKQEAGCEDFELVYI